MDNTHNVMKMGKSNKNVSIKISNSMDYPQHGMKMGKRKK